MMADALNDAGLDMKKIYKPEVDIPWTKESVKEYVWRPIQEVVTKKSSTADAERNDYSMIYDVVNRHFIDKFNISVPWPVMKKCKTCKNEFKPSNSLQVACSYMCAAAYAKKNTHKITKSAERLEKSTLKERREKLKTRNDYFKELQTVFNKYIRLRDKNKPCCSCKSINTNIQYHAGHFFTVKARPELRFDETNVHKQCATCNNHLSGNLINYRVFIDETYGADHFHHLNDRTKHQSLKEKYPHIDDIKEEIKAYKEKVKELIKK